MAFQFSLESLLRLRRSQQRQQEILVQKENDRVRQLIRELEVIGNEFALVAANGGTSLDLRGAELQFDNSRRLVLGERFVRTAGLLQQAQERQVLLAAELHSMWQLREVLETLRQHELRAHAIEEGRREQRRQDDLFLLRKQKR